MNLESKLKASKVVIITHTFATGPGQELETYLKGKVKNLIFIGHPLPFCQDLNSVLKEYNHKGRLIKEKKAAAWPLPEALLYLKDVFLTLRWLLFDSGSNLVVGINCLNAFCGWLLKKLGKTKRLVFYTIDYVPQRFKNPVLNKIYHFLDSFSVRHADLTWNLSPVMAKERKKKGVTGKQITVPIGTNLDVKRLPFKKINRWEIAFMGHLRTGQGLELLLNSLPEVLKKIPQASLVLIGTGPLQEKLKRQALKLGIKNKVAFTGFVKDHTKMQNRLAKAALAVAPYIDDKKSYTRYTDPGKPKAYLASGLPVVITDIVQIAKEVEKARCGLAIGSREKELVAAVVNLLKDEKKLKLYRKNALAFAQKFAWHKIFEKALRVTFKEEEYL